MGSALSTGGGLTESQKKRARIMNISNSEFKQFLLNNQKIKTKLIKEKVYPAGKQVVTKKKSVGKSRSRTKRY